MLQGVGEIGIGKIFYEIAAPFYNPSMLFCYCDIIHINCITVLYADSIHIVRHQNSKS